MVKQRGAPPFRAFQWIAAFAVLLPITNGYTQGACPQQSVSQWTLLADSIAITDLDATAATSQKSNALNDKVVFGIQMQRRFIVSGDYHDRNRAEAVWRQLISTMPGCAWFHYMLAKTLVQPPNGYTGPTIMRDIAGQRRVREAKGWDALLHAINLDPTLAAASELLAVTALRRNEKALLRDANAKLDELAPTRLNSGARSAHVAIKLIVGDHNGLSALLSAPVNAITPSEAYMLAIARMLTDVDENVAEYWTAIARADHAAKGLLLADIGYLLTQDERLDLSHVRPAALPNVLHRFWSSRAAPSGITEAERIREHYRRVYTARRDYPRVFTGRLRGRNEVLLDTLSAYRDVDDRGLLLIKFGPPDEEIQVIGSPDPSKDMDTGTMLWIYRRFNRPTTFYLSGLWPEGYSLIPGFARCDENAASIIARSDPRVWPIINDCRRAARDPAEKAALELNKMALIARLRDDQRVGVQGDDGRPRFTATVPFYFDLYTFQGKADSTEVVASTFIPIAKLKGVTEVWLTVSDTAAGLSWRAKRTIDVGERTDAASFARVNLVLQALPSPTAQYRVGVRSQGDATMGQTYGGPLNVPRYSRQLVQISDLLLADPDTTSGSFARFGTKLNIVPTNEFTGDVFGIYYEVYNLSPVQSYRTRLTLRPADSGLAARFSQLIGGRSELTVSFESNAGSDGTLKEFQRIGTELPSGTYRVQIDVLGSDSRVLASSERLLKLPKRQSN